MQPDQIRTAPNLGVTGVHQTYASAPSLDGHLHHWASVRPEAAALYDPSNRKAAGLGTLRKLDYWSLNKIVSRVSALFVEHGLNPGDTILIQLANTVESPITILAAMRAGLVPCVVPLLWRRRELEPVFQKLPIKAIICQGDHSDHGYGEMMRDLAAEHFSVRFLYGAGRNLADGIMPLNEVFERPAGNELGHSYAQQFEPSANDPGIIQWGINPEGKLSPLWRTHAELIGAGMAHILQTGLNQSDRLHNPFPLSSLTGLVAMFAPWLITGATMIQHEPFEEASFLKDLERNEITYTILPAPIFKKHYESGTLRQAAPDLKAIGCVWPPQNLSTHKANNSTIVDPSISIYDIINVGDFASLILPRSEQRRANSFPLGQISVPFGSPECAPLLETKLKGTVQKAASELSSLSGNLLIRGPLVPDAAYALWNGAPKHKEGAEGWINTGLPVSISEGSFDLVSLEKDSAFIYHGGTVMPASDLDAIYMAFDEFIDAAAFTIDDPLVGDRIYAAIVPIPGTSPSMKKFREYLKDKAISPFLLPEKLVVVSLIPRDDEGRVIRDKILNQL